MDSKGKIGYLFLSLGFFALLLGIMSSFKLGAFVALLFGASLLFIIIGASLYMSGYVKRFVVKEIKNKSCGGTEGIKLCDPFRIIDEEGNEYKCAISLQDVFVVGKCYIVKVSYDNEILRILE